jgi:hypothetical protein
VFDPISNYVVGDAYHIAANYLKATGQLSGDVDIHQPLLDSIVDDRSCLRVTGAIKLGHDIGRCLCSMRDDICSIRTQR